MMMFFKGRVSLVVLAVLSYHVTSFVPSSTTNNGGRLLARTASSSSSVPRFLSSSSEQTATTTTASQLNVPMTWDEMIRQVATAMKQAAAEGTTRQIVRILLPRDATNADFGKYFEDEEEERVEMTLVPPDESWQGGIMQLYRAAAPTASKILRQLTQDNASGLPPRITEDRSIDESGVDGVGLFTTDDKAVACFVQPTQEIVDIFVQRATANNDKIVVLLNPQWRQVDDALDSASQGDGFLSGLASFLGGKGAVLKRMSEAGYKSVYNLEGYVCRGANVRLLQVNNSDWAVFCERDDGSSYISVGTCQTRPTYQQVDEMLNESEIGLKYARDIGLAPKL